MSLEEDTEPKWVLKRLMNGLEMDLKGRAERHVRRDIGDICAVKDFAESGENGDKKEQ